MGWGGGGKRGDKERERRVKRGRSEGPSGISEVDREKDWEREEIFSQAQQKMDIAS